MSGNLDQLLAREVAGAAALRVAGRSPLDVTDSVHQSEKTSIRSRDQLGTSTPEITDYFADLQHRSQRISPSRSPAHSHFEPLDLCRFPVSAGRTLEPKFASSAPAYGCVPQISTDQLTERAARPLAAVEHSKCGRLYLSEG